MSGALYVPDNDRLLAVLDGLPAGLRRYADHAALLIHFTAHHSWTRRAEEDEGPARLHSLILRRYIPDRMLRRLRKHLETEGVLICDGYYAGRYSIGYQIAPDFDGLPRRWELSDTTLIDKWQAWKNSTIKTAAPEMKELAERRKAVTDTMIETLDCLRLCAPVGDVETALRGHGIDPAHLRYACSVIHNGDHDGLCMDPFGWRVHSIVTHTTAEIRPFLSFGNGPLVELDVRNAQPLIFAAALRNPALCATYIGSAQHNGRWPRLLEILRAVPLQEVNELVRLCEAGQFYEAFLGVDWKRDREKVKRAVYRDVFFGKLIQHGPITEVFTELFPGIYDAILGIKRECGYKSVARLLQRLESTIMIDGVCRQIVTELPGVRFLTIHDAALVVFERSGDVCRLIEGEFARYGVRATVRRKVLKKT